uniref:Uncharacterized protein n=1 Tax=Anopheles melas TaxID=34690 RepID=A0A182TQR0_9DIPT
MWSNVTDATVTCEISSWSEMRAAASRPVLASASCCCTCLSVSLSASSRVRTCSSSLRILPVASSMSRSRSKKRTKAKGERALQVGEGGLILLVAIVRRAQPGAQLVPLLQQQLVLGLQRFRLLVRPDAGGRERVGRLLHLPLERRQLLAGVVVPALQLDRFLRVRFLYLEQMLPQPLEVALQPIPLLDQQLLLLQRQPLVALLGHQVGGKDVGLFSQKLYLIGEPLVLVQLFAQRRTVGAGGRCPLGFRLQQLVEPLNFRMILHAFVVLGGDELDERSHSAASCCCCSAAAVDSRACSSSDSLASSSWRISFSFPSQVRTFSDEVCCSCCSLRTRLAWSSLIVVSWPCMLVSSVRSCSASCPPASRSCCSRSASSSRSLRTSARERSRASVRALLSLSLLSSVDTLVSSSSFSSSTSSSLRCASRYSSSSVRFSRCASSSCFSSTTMLSSAFSLIVSSLLHLTFSSSSSSRSLFFIRLAHSFSY